eukprot:GHVP01021323.1.p1 GENE.GHVP01021323.1~~GHVP01021323.1.p1  ORF type:complete len:110 (+),score=3.40 GHVP01021323.1:334-663(+)
MSSTMSWNTYRIYHLNLPRVLKQKSLTDFGLLSMSSLASISLAGVIAFSVVFFVRFLRDRSLFYLNNYLKKLYNASKLPHNKNYSFIKCTSLEHKNLWIDMFWNKTDLI